MFNNSNVDVSPEYWNDALVVGDLGSAECLQVLAKTVPALCGQSSKHPSNRWLRWEPSLRGLIETTLSHHPARERKDGDSIVFAKAEAVSEELGRTFCSRRKDAVTAISVAGFDIDDGSSLEEVKERLESLGFFAIVYTTHSHGKASTTLDWNAVLGEPTADAIEARASELGLINPKFEGVSASLEASREVTVQHDPIDKFRVLLPLAESFSLIGADRKARLKKEREWRERLRGFADKVLGVEIDESGCDVNRLFYVPRHPIGRTDWETTIFAGRAIRIEDMPRLEMPTRGAGRKSAAGPVVWKGGERPLLSDGFDLLAWNREFGFRFLVVDFVEALGWDVRTGGVPDERAEIECPNDAAHANAGDLNDRACLIRNGDGDDRFVVTCRHGHCVEIGKLEMLVALEAQAALPDCAESFSRLLCDESFYLIADDEMGPVWDDYMGFEPPACSAEQGADAPPLEHATAESVLRGCVQMLEKAGTQCELRVRGGEICVRKGTGDDEIWLPVCSPFEVLGRSYTEREDGSGLVVRFAADRTGNPVCEETVSRAALHEDSRKVVGKLIDRGFRVIATSGAKQALEELLSVVRIEKDIVTLSVPGWHDGVFVSPSGQVIGASEKHYRLSPNMWLSGEAVRGDLEGWSASVQAALGSANGDLLAIGLLSGFAGCLANLLKLSNSPLISFSGTTTRGKTTAQRLGASVWSNPFEDGLLVKFNTTKAGLEPLAQKASGTLLALDEGGQSGLSGQQLQEAVFSLAEGQGRQRLKATGEQREVRHWLTCITMSEEIGFASRVSRDGRKAAAGAVARCWEISFDDAEQLSLEVIDAVKGIKSHFGQAGPLFAQYLIQRGYNVDYDKIQRRIDESETALLEGVTAKPQHRRVASSAALLLVAGELAKEAGLIPSGYLVEDAVRRVLHRSLNEMAGSIDPIASAIDTLRESLPLRNGHDVLALNHDDERVLRPAVAYYDDQQDRGAFGSSGRKADRTYYIPKELLSELAGGAVPPGTIAKELKRQGYLMGQSAKNSAWPAIPGKGKVSHYRIKGSFFHDDADEEERSQAGGQVIAIAAE